MDSKQMFFLENSLQTQDLLKNQIALHMKNWSFPFQIVDKEERIFQYVVKVICTTYFSNFVATQVERTYFLYDTFSLWLEEI